MPLILVPTLIQPQLKAAAHDILEGVEAGEITGLGVVVVLKERRFFVDVIGSVARDPHAARGYVAALDDCLREIAHRKRDTSTTR
jgi:hypothetical protein